MGDTIGKGGFWLDMLDAQHNAIKTATFGIMDMDRVQVRVLKSIPAYT